MTRRKEALLYAHLSKHPVKRHFNDSISLFLSLFLLSGQDKCVNEVMTETDNWTSSKESFVCESYNNVHAICLFFCIQILNTTL